MTSESTVERVCLVVDDEASLRTHIRSILEPEPYRVLEAENGIDALRFVHRLGGALDLIVSDIKMPGDMSGIELAYSIRLTFPAIPILLISGYAEFKGEERSSKFEFIQKPFRPDELLGAVRRITAERLRIVKA